MRAGKRSETSKGAAVSKDKLLQSELCETWQELGKGHLEYTSNKTVSGEGYRYASRKCKKINEFRIDCFSVLIEWPEYYLN